MQQAEQIRLYRAGWKEAGHTRTPRVSVSRSIFALIDDRDRMLLIGKAALNRGYAFDVYAFPTNGIPQFRLVGPAVDKSVVYAIARQESAFNPRAVSSAKALGLMQVLPGTGKLIAKKFGFAFDRNRMAVCSPRRLWASRTRAC